MSDQTNTNGLDTLIAAVKTAQDKYDRARAEMKTAQSDYQTALQAVANSVATQHGLAVGDRLRCEHEGVLRKPVDVSVRYFRIWRDVEVFGRSEPLIEAVGPVILANGHLGVREVAVIVNSAKSRVSKLPPR